MNAEARNRVYGQYLLRQENRERRDLQQRARQLRAQFQQIIQANVPPPPPAAQNQPHRQENAQNQIAVGIDGLPLPNANTPLSDREVDDMLQNNQVTVAAGDEPFQCPVCYDEPTQWIRSRNCRHGFCSLCFLNHTARSRFCSLCRVELYVLVAPRQNGQQQQQQNNPNQNGRQPPNLHRPLTNEEASDMLMNPVIIDEGQAPFQCPVCNQQFVSWIRSRNCGHGMCPLCFINHTSGARFCPQCHVELYVPVADRN